MSFDITRQEILQVPEAIRATVRGARSMAASAAEEMKRRHGGRVFLVGNGTSFYSALAATYTARRFQTVDSPDVLAVQAGDFRYFQPLLRPNDVVVGISASGEFRDVVHVFEQLKGHCLLVGITHVPGSSLVGLSDICLVGLGGASRVPIMTKTYASTLTAAHLLMLECLDAPAEAYEELLHTADRCGHALTEAEPRMRETARLVSQYDHAYIYGAGPGYATALEGALKLKETCLLHAEASETWEMASGPATAVDRSSLLLPVYTGGAGDDATAEFTRHAKAWGPAVIPLGSAAPGRDAEELPPAPVQRCFSSLATVPVVAMLACEVAKVRGLNPDAPAWRERYAVQGMTHAVGK